MKRIVAISISLFSYMVLVFSLNGQREIGHPAFMSPHFSPIVISQDKVFVQYALRYDRRPGCQVRGLFRRIPVGLDPVSLAIRPDCRELWVSNHV